MAQTNAAAQAVANIYKTPELWQKITFTLLCLVIYRAGAHVTAPGIDVTAMMDFFASQGGGGLLGLYNLFVGGSLERATCSRSASCRTSRRASSCRSRALSCPRSTR
jgi:preprotein translocase subunit SecY